MQCLDSLVDALDTVEVMRDVVVDRELAGQIIADQLRYIRSALDRPPQRYIKKKNKTVHMQYSIRGNSWPHITSVHSLGELRAQRAE